MSLDDDDSTQSPRRDMEAREGFIREDDLMRRQPPAVFLWGGLLFLAAGLLLFFFAAYALYRLSEAGPIFQMSEVAASSDAQTDMTRKELYEFYGQLITFFLSPVLMVFSAMICTFVGRGLLKAAGIVTERVIPQHDMEILAPALSNGNEKCINEYIRLSSLRGVTGTFTKVGLTGLPLATIFLTVVLALIGIFNDKFFDLAQLTLGAFIGSFVQKRSDLVAPDDLTPTEN